MVDQFQLLFAIGLVGSYVCFVALRLYHEAVAPPDPTTGPDGPDGQPQPTPGVSGDTTGSEPNLDLNCDRAVQCECCGAVNECEYRYCWNCVSRLP